jgi:hypothetical protein
MSIRVPRRGTKRSWIPILLLVVLTIAVLATGYFGLKPTP